MGFVQYCLNYWHSFGHHSVNYCLIILDHLGKASEIHDGSGFQNLRVSHHAKLKLKYRFNNRLLLISRQVLNLCIDFHADAHLPRVINNRHTRWSVKLYLRLRKCSVLLEQVRLTSYDRWLVIADVGLFSSDRFQQMNVNSGEILLIVFFELILLPLQIYIPYGGCVLQSLWVLAVDNEPPILIIQL